jgi:hypothetical protein
MRISFDFDSTLDEVLIQKLCRIFMKSNECEVFIITSRYNDEFHKNTDLFKISDNLGIRRENIHFTNGDFKWKKIKELNITFHFDDMEDEVHLINAKGGCALLFNFDVGMCKWLLDDLERGLLDSNDINTKKI